MGIGFMKVSFVENSKETNVNDKLPAISELYSTQS